ncbi:esterase-like activity of phytase family protein [Pendulispora albinea]|uniref:Esterase-like activity of phytase family protein n=1 Tax=Pendulispora albinea TaxID=2741071 RepID=A0ABZ2M183_9BACT
MIKTVAALMLVASGCSHGCSRAPSPQAYACEGASLATERTGAPAVSAYAVVDFPRGTGTHELSGTAFDEATRTLYAIEDKAPKIVSFVASPDYRSWSAGTPILLSGYLEDRWDGEGLVRLPDGSFYVVANESEPVLAHFDARGAFIQTMNVPSDYAKQISNKGLESLTLSPDGRYLFSANEAALASDGPGATKALGTVVRIWRHDLTTAKDEEFAYRTEPLGAGGGGGDMGVSELAALSADELLVLERGFQHGYGNTVRIFRIDLTGAKNVAGVPSLDDTTAVRDKILVADLGNLTCAGVTHKGPQPNPILENYEALTVGPLLPDGRRLLFLASDDNGRSDQVARLLVLAVTSL